MIRTGFLNHPSYPSAFYVGISTGLPLHMAVELPSEADIHCSAQTVFDLIVDFDGQDRWLKQSSAFRGTRNASENPAVLGTTYREPGPLGVRNGTVTEHERPTRVTFHQPMTIKLGLGIVDITLRYLLTPTDGTTHVRRAVTITVPPRLRLVQPLIIEAFRRESGRTLVALKAYADVLT
jgi:uncharacterized protein YndB with AHSA1/START domain